MQRTRLARPAIQIIQNIVNSPQINVTCFCVAKIVLMSAWPERRRPDSVFPQTAGRCCSTKAAAILSRHEKDSRLLWIFHKRTLTLMITNIIFMISHHCQSGSSHRSGVQYWCFVDNLAAYMRIDIGIFLCLLVCMSARVRSYWVEACVRQWKCGGAVRGADPTLCRGILNNFVTQGLQMMMLVLFFSDL